MRAVVIICAIVCLLSKHSFAQSFRGTLLSGINASQVDGDQFGGFNKSGLLAGGGVAYALTDDFDLMMEMYYIQKGSRSVPSDSYFFRWRINYIEIPFLIKYKLISTLSGLAGLSADVLISSEQEIGAGKFNVTNQLNRINPAYTLGFEYKLYQNWEIGARFVYSMIPANTNVNVYAPKIYNNSIAVLLKYRFGDSD